MKTVLIITAHPDDAEIGMGGTALKNVKSGNRVINIISCLPHPGNIRRKEAIESANLLGIECVFLDENMNEAVEHYEYIELVTLFDNLIEKYKPDIIYTHWDEDSHQDHRIISNSVQSCLRKNLFSLYFFEQINQKNPLKGSAFTPNVFVDITDYYYYKYNAFLLHKSQNSGNTAHYAKDMEKLASWRGNQIGVEKAEAFKLVFSVQ
ncbi:PIG-L deacetylase family protein [Planococcus halotolerans]|uniref:GlcNAc-PI de-N-acetylase n=1 Tax=Planococcus halotolerans TaxID=2233542 RepID=A0A365KL42_9BACL|nr:PIG-L deacetylase family protein [Planococcus halotolerans]RAZ73463.1 GlcNAc-PI de-N-acetylase [Planococcus halotolerans]